MPSPAAKVAALRAMMEKKAQSHDGVHSRFCYFGCWLQELDLEEIEEIYKIAQAGAARQLRRSD